MVLPGSSFDGSSINVDGTGHQRWYCPVTRLMEGSINVDAATIN
jgi:hypothetical protein